MTGQSSAPGSRQSNAVAWKLRVHGKLVTLECPFCHKRWHVQNKGRATGFVVAAANCHAMKCDLNQRRTRSSAVARPQAIPTSARMPVPCNV